VGFITDEVTLLQAFRGMPSISTLCIIPQLLKTHNSFIYSCLFITLHLTAAITTSHPFQILLLCETQITKTSAWKLSVLTFRRLMSTIVDVPQR